MTDEAVQTPARRSRRWFGWGLAAVFALFLGGCAAVLASVNSSLESRTGAADPDDYRVSVDVCRVDDVTPFASGTISNAGDSARGFRVQVTTFDGETAAILGSRSVPVSLEPGETGPFEMYILDFRDLDGSSLPDVVGCVASVFYN